MKIAIYSDLHLEHAPFQPPEGLQADVVVLAGDIHSPGHKTGRWARRPSIFGDRPVIHVAGNHEFYGSEYHAHRRLMRSHAQQAGVHHLNESAVVIGGVRFLGCTLWTDFALHLRQVDGTLRSDIHCGMTEADLRLNDYVCIRLDTAAAGDSPRAGDFADDAARRRLRPHDTLAMHQRERQWLLNELERPFDGPTVVVSHHAPHRLSLADVFAPDPLSAAFVSELPEVFFRIPVLWIHGHTHTSFDYLAGACRVVCNPRGYPMRWQAGFENPQFDPMGLGIVVPVSTAGD